MIFHQHTSYIMKHKALGNLSPAFAEVVCSRFADAAQLAIDDMSEAEMSVAARETAEPIAFVRRYILKDGRAVTTPQKSRSPRSSADAPRRTTPSVCSDLIAILRLG